MKITVLIVLALLQSSLSAPKGKITDLESAYIDKLNKPWFVPHPPSQYPRKGETLCKGRPCKPSGIACEDCQVNVPIDVNWR
ncbi:unnamed protein product [Colias eurytheme]|nr:unnamed protein product [Colias eurytheme]